MRFKKIMVGLLVGTLMMGTAATAHAEVSVEKSSSTSKSRLVTDAVGNEYEVTHVIETVNDETTEYYSGIPLIVHNETADEMTAIYLANSDSDSWGGNGFEMLGEDFTLSGGQTAYGMTMIYYADNTIFDVRFIRADGEELIFEQFDFAKEEEPDLMDLYLWVDEETQAYNLTLDITAAENGGAIGGAAPEAPQVEIPAVSWSDFEGQLENDERLASGSFYEDEAIGLKYFIPGDMFECELDEADLEAGYLRQFRNENEEQMFIYVVQDEEVTDIYDYKANLEEEYGMEITTGLINGMPVAGYTIPEDLIEENPNYDRMITFAFAANDGTIIEFSFFPANESTEFAEVYIPVMVASIQALEE